MESAAEATSTSISSRTGKMSNLATASFSLDFFSAYSMIPKDLQAVFESKGLDKCPTWANFSWFQFEGEDVADGFLHDRLRGAAFKL